MFTCYPAFPTLVLRPVLVPQQVYVRVNRWLWPVTSWTHKACWETPLCAGGGSGWGQVCVCKVNGCYHEVTFVHEVGEQEAKVCGKTELLHWAGLTCLHILAK